MWKKGSLVTLEKVRMDCLFVWGMTTSQMNKRIQFSELSCSRFRSFVSLRIS